MSWVRQVAALCRSLVRSETSKIKTWRPGQVVEYDGATNKAKIRLCRRSIRTEDPNNMTTANLPILEDVPVHQHGSGKLVRTTPVTADSYGIVLFSDCDIEEWLSAGGVIDPKSLRRWELSDAVFIPGLYPFVFDGDNGQIEAAIQTDRMSTRTRSGLTEISVLDDESVYINVNDGAAQITVDLDGNIEIANDGDTTITSGGDITNTSGGEELTIGTTINAGNGTGFVALSQDLDIWISKVDTVLRSWVVAPMDGGAALKAAYIGAAPTPPTSVASGNLKAD